MRKIINLTLSLSLLLIAFGSCAMRDELKGKNGGAEDENGLMALALETDKPINMLSRAKTHSFDPEDLNIETYIVRILDASGEEVTKKTYNELGSEISLKAGTYTLQAYNYEGAEVTSNARPYFFGETKFNILANKTTNVETTCRMSNVGVMLFLTDEFTALFEDDYAITVTNGGTGTHTFDKTNISNAVYLNVPENSSAIQLTMKTTTRSKQELVVYQVGINRPSDTEGSTNLKANEIFMITLNPGEEPGVDYETKIKWGVTVDLNMNDRKETIEIPTENISTDPGPGDEDGIKIVGLDKTYEVPADLSASVPTVQVEFTVPRGIKNLFVTIDSDNEGFVETLAEMGLIGQFDLANPGDLPLGGSLENGSGIGLIDNEDPVSGKTQYLFDITEFMALLRLFGTGSNTFTIQVNDGVDTASGVLTIKVVD